MEYYKETKFLPQIPNYLIDDIDTIKSRGNVFDSKYAHFYSSYLVSSDLKLLLADYFDKPINVRYQLISAQLPVHIDAGGISNKYNYLLTTGGDCVTTRWWDSLENPTNMLYENCAALHVWHELNVSVPHDISPIESYRLSIEIHIPTKKEYLDEV
jgi:hypothetical protein